jgi:anaerobic magnesium-protoporphyrin IX monomethyl ester cyclase
MSENIMLVNPPARLDRQIVQPLGIASIAGQLRSAGYSNISIIDGCYLVKKHGYRKSFQIIGEEIERTRPFVVGCTLHSSMLEETERVCEYALKVHSNVIIGGHGATACHEASAMNFYTRARACNSSSITAVVRGEGEETAKQLVDALFQHSSLYGIEGVTFYDGNVVVVNPGRELLDMNTLEPPAIDLLPAAGEYGGWYNIEESRGCVFQCSFCSIRSMYPVVRLKHPERIRVEVEQAHDLGAERIYLTGELTLLDTDRAIAISDIIRSYGMQWSTSAHPSLIGKAKSILPVLKRSGLVCLEVGIEAGSQRSLDLFNKGTTPKKNQLAMRILESEGISPWLHFIPFHPYMNMRDLYENVMFMTRNLSNFLGRPNFPDYLSHAWVPTEGTTLFERAHKDGLITRRSRKTYVRYEDSRVIEAKRSYDHYFIKKYGKEYYRLHGELIKMIDTMNSDDLHENKKFMLIGTLPLSALYVAYACALTGVPAQKHVESLVGRFFEVIHSDYSCVSYSDLCRSVLEEIEGQRR